MSGYKYKRVLLKLSGEALACSDGNGLDHSLIKNLGNEIKKAVNNGVQIAIVVGGGNIIRGANQKDIDRVNADYMGMLATVINAMGLAEGFKNIGLDAKAVSSIPMERVCDTYIIRDVRKCLNNGQVVILGGGTSSPYFTTDTNASLRACELQCDCLLKATKVDGVYDSDPANNNDAKRYETISYDEVLEKGLRVMDWTAISMCMENKIPLVVFDISAQGNIEKVLQGKNVGTLVN